MITIPYSLWKKKGKSLFGDNTDNWIFECPICFNKQSISSILLHNPSLNKEDIRKWVFNECEGRITQGYGCNHSVNGLIDTSTYAVIINKEESFKSFDFAKIS